VAPVRISEAIQDAGLPRVAVDPQGDAVAIWTAGTGEAHNVDAGRYLSADVLGNTASTSVTIAISPRPRVITGVIPALALTTNSAAPPAASPATRPEPVALLI
jgi:hypothetical protein